MWKTRIIPMKSLFFMIVLVDNPVDNLVDNLWITRMSQNLKSYPQVLCGYPQVIHRVIHRFYRVIQRHIERTFFVGS